MNTPFFFCRLLIKITTKIESKQKYGPRSIILSEENEASHTSICNSLSNNDWEIELNNDSIKTDYFNLHQEFLKEKDPSASTDKAFVFTNTPNKTNPISITIDNRVNILDAYPLAPTNDEKHRNLASRYPHSLSEDA